MIEIKALTYYGPSHVWGIIPSFIDPFDERPIVEQISAHYIGKWRDFIGFTLLYDWDDPFVSTLSYPGDPTYKCRGYVKLRKELLMMFDHSWAVVVQADDTWRCARLD